MDTPHSSSTRFMLSPYANESYPIKPKFFKNFGDVFSKQAAHIFNYLSLPDLSTLRTVSKLFLGVVNEYYEQRLKDEIQEITNLQNENQDKINIYMRNIDSQIPISHKEWLCFDLNKVTNDIKQLDKDTILELKSIKRLNKMSDKIYAPFCIIFGKKEDKRYNSWKKICDGIINDKNFCIKAAYLDYENFNDNEILEAFLYLNQEDMELDKIYRYSKTFGNLVKWCQAVVSYHILIHPYTFRNPNSNIKSYSDVYDFIKVMEDKINKFYLFKRFLFKLELVKIPLGDYVFNLQHKRDLIKSAVNYDKVLNAVNLGNILSYLPLSSSYKFISLSKLGLESFKNSLFISCYEILKEIGEFKIESFDKLSKNAPIIYENNIFSKYFMMLDDILNSVQNPKETGFNFIQFLTKENLTYIKNIKNEKNDDINSICKIICSLFELRPEKYSNSLGEIINNYVKPVKLLAINGTLNKKLRHFNKLQINKNQIKVLIDELIKFYSTDKLNNIRSINKGLYQLLIWEFFLFEYLKEFNPFLFLGINFFKNSEIFQEDEMKMLNYYNDMLNFLKYNLVAKFHFHSVSFAAFPEAPTYEFMPLTNLLAKNNQYLLNNFSTFDQVDSNVVSNFANCNVFDTVNKEKAKISNIYFETKNAIPNNSKSVLFTRIMEEIIAVNENIVQCNHGRNSFNDLYHDSNNNYTSKNNELGTIEEEKGLSDKVNREMIPINRTLKETDIKNYCNINSSQEYWEEIPEEIFIKNILFYLDLVTLPKFSLVNKKFHKCLKTHMFLRLYFLEQEKQVIEQDNDAKISRIFQKRSTFFAEYEMVPPNKEHACALMSQLTNDDVTELKSIFRKYNSTNEKIIAPMVVLLGLEPLKTFSKNGTRSINFFKPAQSLIASRSFVKRLQNLNLEMIPSAAFKFAEHLMKDHIFRYDKLRSFSPCLIHLINWEMGVLEYHRAVRKFCLSDYDFQVLSEEEAEFCGTMDSITLLYFKLKHFASVYCWPFEDYALKLLKDLEDDNVYMDYDGKIEGNNLEDIHSN